ncbi:hypothetical protein C8F04DRAFT_454953 [Mycena alexandri]|uniref:Uncharacterized protein n=1 Tax=Mycena alexandri TaxID=1745969 RepID=A0AAD6XF43_9AGAR|nr:hypothetical protein C8F04DRAFT_454953 [Mycena alexandri]
MYTGAYRHAVPHSLYVVHQCVVAPLFNPLLMILTLTLAVHMSPSAARRPRPRHPHCRHRHHCVARRGSADCVQCHRLAFTLRTCSSLSLPVTHESRSL